MLSTDVLEAPAFFGDEKRRRKHLAAIRSAVRQASDLLDDLDLLVMMEHGSCTSAPMAPLAEVMQTVREELAVQAEATDVAFVPEWNCSITAAYDRMLGGGDLHASVTVLAQDDLIIAGSPPNNFIVEDSYALLDARVSYQWNLASDDFLRVSVFGDLTDEEYKEQILLLGVDGGFQGWGPPRQVALEVLYSR